MLLCILVCLMVGGTVTGFAVSAAEKGAAQELTPKLYVTFYNVGTGDCIFVKWENTEILIDTGEKSGNADVFVTLEGLRRIVSEKCTDKKLEYVIATHGDSDHIGLMGDFLDMFNLKRLKESGRTDWYLSGYSVGNVIDFDSSYNAGLFTSQAYNKYVSARNSLVKETKTVYKTVSEYFGKTKKTYQTIPFSDSSSAPKLHILYNEYYFEETANAIYCNSVSVCLCIEYGESKVLLTGDLEEKDSVPDNPKTFEGETRLYRNNESLLSGGVTLYKASHHGSNTSNSEAFIENIHPKYVVISATASNRSGKPYYGFPKQEVVERFLKYTPNVYITARDNDPGSDAAYYGNITCALDADGNMTVDCDNPDMKENGNLIPITQTPWYIDNRCSLRTRVFDVPNADIGHCTLLSYQHYDVLIDCGIDSREIGRINMMTLADMVCQYCSDGVLECVVITNSQTESLSNVIGRYNADGPLNDGIFGKLNIQYLIDFGNQTNSNSSQNAQSWLARYYEQRDSLTDSKYYDSSVELPAVYSICDGFSLTVLDRPHDIYMDENDYSVCVLVNFFGEKLLFTGDLTNAVGLERELVKRNASLLSNVTFYLVGNNGYESSSSNELLTVIRPEYAVIPVSLGLEMHGYTYPSFPTCQRLLNNIRCTGGVRHLYALGQIVDGRKQESCGTVTFTMTVQNGKVIRKELSGSADTELLQDTSWYKQKLKE